MYMYCFPFVSCATYKNVYYIYYIIFHCRWRVFGIIAIGVTRAVQSEWCPGLIEYPQRIAE